MGAAACVIIAFEGGRPSVIDGRRSERDDDSRRRVCIGQCLCFGLCLGTSRTDGKGTENERAEGKRHDPFGVLRPQRTRERAGEQPHEVHECDGQGDLLMSHLLCQELEAVCAVGLGDLFAAEKAPHHREGGVDRKYTGQDQ